MGQANELTYLEWPELQGQAPTSLVLVLGKARDGESALAIGVAYSGQMDLVQVHTSSKQIETIGLFQWQVDTITDLNLMRVLGQAHMLQLNRTNLRNTALAEVKELDWSYGMMLLDQGLTKLPLPSQPKLMYLDPARELMFVRHKIVLDLGDTHLSYTLKDLPSAFMQKPKARLSP